MGKVRVTVIDDRERTFLEECPFQGEHLAPVWRDGVAHSRRRCNVNQTSSPVCVGPEHEGCSLRQYDRFVVEAGVRGD